MIRIAKYFTVTLLAVFAVETGEVPVGAEVPTFQEWRLVGDSGQDVKACVKVCKTKGTKCKRKCYGTADDIACKAECTAVRAVCYKVCKGEKPQPPQ